MIALVRRLGIPCRYVSGYLYHVKENHDRSEDDASHAWVEAYLPGLCWRGFDPTNNLVVGERHIRVAAGRDYAECLPPAACSKAGRLANWVSALASLPAQSPSPPRDRCSLAPSPRRRPGPADGSINSNNSSNRTLHPKRIEFIIGQLHFGAFGSYWRAGARPAPTDFAATVSQYHSSGGIPMQASTKMVMTPEEYLKQERKAPFKSEYYAGEVFAMAGASPRHTLIVTNTVYRFVGQLKGRHPCTPRFACEGHPASL